MAKTLVVSVDPTSSSALTLSGVALRIPAGRLRRAESVAAEAGLVQLVFPSRDAGLGISLAILVWRIALASVGSYAAAIWIFSGTVPLVVAIGGLGCSVFLLIGLLVRPAALGLAIMLLQGSLVDVFVLWIGLMSALVALLVVVAGGGWFAADYHIGRRICRVLRRQSEMRSTGYSAFIYN